VSTPQADPSGRVTGVIRDGRLDDVTVEGLASADSGEPLTRSSRFYVGSLAKQFVAACARTLVDDGVLNVDAPVSEYIVELPAWGNDVRVRHLIHHTSGISDRDRGGSPPPPGGYRKTGDADLMAEIRTLETTAFAPGTRYAYSNRGYQLLGQIVAAVGGRSLPLLAEERLFAPLDMRTTFFRDQETALPPEAARGHFIANDGRIYVEPARFHAVGAGGLWTTVDDLARWDAAFYDDGSIASKLVQRGALDDGTPIHYGWGISIRSHRGLPIQSHGGGFPGWTAKMARFPTERTTVIILANGETGDVSADAFALADRVLSDALDPSAPHADETFDGVT
jgi:CubicO group peptidase (beta-lactamase class C family)